MSAILRVYSALAYVIGGRTYTVGDMKEPVAEVTTPGAGYRPVQVVRVNAGARVVLWRYGHGPERFSVMQMRLLTDDGYAYCAYKVDTPVSDTDDDPSGSNIRWRAFDLSCLVPMLLNTDNARVNPVIADDYGDSGGNPVILDDSGTVNGFIYEIQAKNPSTTTAIDIEISGLG